MENLIFRLGRPSDPVKANLPWSLRYNLRQKRKKRATDSTADNELTDDIDDEYEFIDYGEESASDTEPSWPTFNNITETQARDHCETYLKASPPYKACGDTIAESDFNVVVGKCLDDIQVHVYLNVV